ncbi:MAG: TIGR03086 family metal-binding protein [Actinomycetota bacterium]|nr:TIGR03086 family metal-binding protein [Actinomycetota bacterium]
MSDFAGDDRSDQIPNDADLARLHRLETGLAEFGQRVHGVDDAGWEAPTPNAGWSVRDLVDHLIDEHRWAPPLLAGHDLDAAGKIVAAQSGTDRPADDWDSVALLSRRAFEEPGVLQRTVLLSAGPTRARDYLAEMTLDLAVHSWDLARALGEDGQLPPDLVAGAQEHLHRLGDVSNSSMFGVPVDVAQDASPTDRLVAATGRRPDWRP